MRRSVILLERLDGMDLLLAYVNKVIRSYLLLYTILPPTRKTQSSANAPKFISLSEIVDIKMSSLNRPSTQLTLSPKNL